MTLAFQIDPDGGVIIAGTAAELLNLAEWLALAARHGEMWKGVV